MNRKERPTVPFEEYKKSSPEDKPFWAYVTVRTVQNLADDDLKMLENTQTIGMTNNPEFTIFYYAIRNLDEVVTAFCANLDPKDDYCLINSPKTPAISLAQDIACKLVIKNHQDLKVLLTHIKPGDYDDRHGIWMSKRGITFDRSKINRI